MENTRPKLIRKSRDGALLHKKFKRHTTSITHLRPEDMTKKTSPRRRGGSLSALLKRRMTQNKLRGSSYSFRTRFFFKRPVSITAPSLDSNHVMFTRLQQHRAGREAHPVCLDRTTQGGSSHLGTVSTIAPTILRRFSEDVADRNLDTTYLRLFGSESGHPDAQGFPRAEAVRNIGSPQIAETIQTSKASQSSGERRIPNAILINAGDRRFSEDFADRNISTYSQSSSIPSVSIGQDHAYGYKMGPRAVPLFEQVYSSSPCSRRLIYPKTRSLTPLERTVLSTEEGSLLVDFDDRRHRGTASCTAHAPSVATAPGRRHSEATARLGFAKENSSVASSPLAEPSSPPWTVGSARFMAMRTEAETLIQEHIGRPGAKGSLEVTKTPDAAVKRLPSSIYGLFPAPPRHPEGEGPRSPDKKPRASRRVSNKDSMTVVSEKIAEEGAGASVGLGIWPLKFRTDSGTYESLEQVVKEKRRRMAGHWSIATTEEKCEQGSQTGENDLGHKSIGHAKEMLATANGVAEAEKS